MAQSPEEMAQSMIQNIEAKTGKTLEQWIKIIGSTAHEKHGQIVKFLKAEHGVTHGFASLIAHMKLKGGSLDDDGDSLVEDQYSGAKAALRPIYDALVDVVKSFGDDVTIAPKKSYVSLRRSKQFALIQPSTKTRIDVGIKLKGIEATDRLELSGSFNAMVSHRVRVTDRSQVDAELAGWLESAYNDA